MIVMKFGGTSVESASAIQRVASIVAARRARHPVVVVSAMGKTTNKLLAIANEAVAGNRSLALSLLSDLRAYHVSETATLPGAAEIIEPLFAELEELVK